jgi:hypothetical protein
MNDIKKMVTVIGYQITADGWEMFKNGKIEISDNRSTEYAPKFNNRLAEICYNLGVLAERAIDETLANFLSDVRSRLENYAESGSMAYYRAAMSTTDIKNTKKLMRAYAQIAEMAMKAVKQQRI